MVRVSDEEAAAAARAAFRLGLRGWRMLGEAGVAAFRLGAPLELRDDPRYPDARELLLAGQEVGRVTSVEARFPQGRKVVELVGGGTFWVWDEGADALCASVLAELVRRWGPP